MLGRRLVKGDWLGGDAPRAVPRPGCWSVGRDGRAVGRYARAAVLELRFLGGVQGEWFTEEARWRLRNEIYEVTPQSDRMGCRLSGSPLRLWEAREMVSQPVACGSVQVPPDGQPIVLMAERQTLGGYPQIGHVISVDLPKLAGAWPGTRVKFLEVSREEALCLRQQAERDFAWLQTGMRLLACG
jgi:allophanate hydrolase subunit 2